MDEVMMVLVVDTDDGDDDEDDVLVRGILAPDCMPSQCNAESATTLNENPMAR